MRNVTLTTGLVALAAVLLTACAANPSYDNGREYRSGCHNCGTIDRIERVRLKNQEQNFGAGAVLGAIIGGAIGHQVQKNNSKQKRGYQFDVQLDDRRRAQVTQLERRDLRVGNRVMIRDHRVELLR